LSSLSNLFSVDSFRSTLVDIASLEDEDFDLLQSTVLIQLRDDTVTDKAPSNAEELRERALLILMQAAATESVSSVMEDIGGVNELSDDAKSRFDRALQAGFEQRDHLAALRLRDGFLPLVTDSKVSIDLRVVPGALVASAVPLMTVRLEFDEAISGSRASIFQLNENELDILITQLVDIRDVLTQLKSTQTGVQVIGRGQILGARE
jgi:hypothetical protein